MADEHRDPTIIEKYQAFYVTLLTALNFFPAITVGVLKNPASREYVRRTNEILEHG